MELSPTGFSGATCLEKTKPYEDAAGGRKVADIPTAEMGQLAEAEPAERDR